jgi:prolyl-tRNA synthetase
MRQSNFFAPTLRDVPADAEIKSHQLLLRAGFMRQNASGIYSYMPLGKKVLEKVEQIVREEMDEAGGQELLMPAIQPAELWQETGRWDIYGPELMRLKDRHERDFALGATHEELITSLVRDEIKTYKRLPVLLYQIQTKYRDEKRPRFGLLRGREFIMKDAYSFHGDPETLDEMYKLMYDTYTKVFTRCGLNFRPVVADSGAIGGKDTHEFMALSEVGEDTIAYSTESDFAANIEMAQVADIYEKSSEEEKVLEKVQTDEAKTIEDVAKKLSVPQDKVIKSLLFLVDEEYVLVLVRGDHEVNDIKVKHFFEATNVELADDKTVFEKLQGPVGNVGPIGVEDVKIIADYAVKYVVNGICGANENGFHYKNVNPERDFGAIQYIDLRFIQEGDPSPDGKGEIVFAEGIEVGQVFKLGTRYSETMGAQFLDENGKNQPMIMGCYGIGVSRTVAAVVEQHHDENGIVWPKELAPYGVHLLVLNPKKEEQHELGESLYKQLKEASYDVLFDDRKERPGVKFADADLFGIPLRVVVGKKADEGIVEVKLRKNGETFEVHVSELIELLKKQWAELS